jgi:hypothetical protein
LITNQKGTLQTTELYKLIKHSYTEDEMMDNKIKAFLSPPVFGKLFEKFNGKELPVSMLDKILIREFEIDADIAGRIGNYYIDGCRELGLLGPGNLLSQKSTSGSIEPIQSADEPPVVVQKGDSVSVNLSSSRLYGGGIQSSPTSISGNFSVQVVGPGTDMRIEISEIDDILLLEAIVKKIRKKVELKTNEETN